MEDIKNESKLNTDVNTMSDVELASYKVALDFAEAQIRKLRNANMGDSTVETVSFSDISKETLLTYLKSPKRNEKSIRNASISMYNTSTQYRRLIMQYALMPTWSYVLQPASFDITKTPNKQFKSLYQKAAEKVSRMNLKHEMQKALIIGLREGIFYGVIWESPSSNSFFIQKINPDWCTVTAIEDGTWIFSIDMSKIKENDIYKYPKEFETMYAQYLSTGEKFQEVPSEICFCFKADETSVEYSLPPWASCMPLLLDIEGYKALQETASEIANYKLLSMRIPLDEHNAPKFNFDLATQYYNLLCSELPPFVGAVMSPMEIVDFNFDKNGNLTATDIVSRAERQFWQDSGTSSLLFGDSANTTAGALKLSVKSDEQLVIGWMNQLERIVNRILKNMTGSAKFKISFLPITYFSVNDYMQYYKEASALGMPVKSAYASVLGIDTTEIPGMNYLELELLEMDELVPLTSGYNTSSDDIGRPRKDDDDLGESGEGMREVRE